MDKNNHKDIIKGGKGDKLNPSNVDKKELEMGIKEEMEHTNDKNLAEEIALDHLAEDPKYYSKLKKTFKENKLLIKHLTEKLEKITNKKVSLLEMGYTKLDKPNKYYKVILNKNGKKSVYNIDDINELNDFFANKAGSSANGAIVEVYDSNGLKTKVIVTVINGEVKIQKTIFKRESL